MKISFILISNTVHSQTTLFELLNSDSIKLSKSDQKLAKIVANQADKVIHLSIAELARQASVSEPTVNRFCHKLGCNGYPDFKLRLAQEISAGSRLFVENVSSTDNSSAIIRKVLESIQSSVESLASTLSPQTLDLVAEKIQDCKSVSFFGLGASGSVALDAQHKFIRFGIPVNAHTDVINQRMMCSMMDNKDVAIFISYTGRTQAIIDNTKIARASGASVVGITMSNSPLALECEYVLNAVTAEDTDLFTPMTSRIIHLAVIDMLATSVALRLGDQVADNIRAIKTNLANTRSDLESSK